MIPPDDFLKGGRDMGELMGVFDWSKTPLGPSAVWPQSLRTAISICLNSRFAILVWWGPQLTMLYNDAYRDIIAAKHPRALGQAGHECWSEIWHIVGPMLNHVIETGEATHAEDLLLMLERRGYAEECYFTFSYSAIRDESGQVAGIFTPVYETSAKVIGERRLRILHRLSVRTGKSKDVESACSVAAQVLGENPHDIPFVLIYLCETGQPRLRLVARAGIEIGGPASAASIDPEEAPWPFAAALKTGAVQTVTDLGRLGPLPTGPWPSSPREVVVLPVIIPGHTEPSALIVAGVNPCKLLDHEYRVFFDLVANSVANAVANAHAYEEERRRAESLAELDRAKTTFFNNVSHEFRTPITLMLGPLENLLETDNNLSTNNRQTLEVAARSAQRLLKLVNTLLDFARVDAGRWRASYVPADLASVTADVAATFRSAIEAAGLRFQVRCEPLSQPVFIDRDMWEKIILNLLSNAFKFTLAGVIEVQSQEQNGRAVISVRDSGIGIPAEELPRVFDRFHRVTGTRGRSHEGSGIGLTLVKELAHRLGGEIDVDSAPGHGSTFRVTIPFGCEHLPRDQVFNQHATPAWLSVNARTYVQEALSWLPHQSDQPVSPEDRMEQALTPPSGPPAAAYVLIVDDNADMREYLRQLLAPHCVLASARDGEEALAQIRKVPPSLVVTDSMMPGMDGVGLLGVLRADPATRDIPVLMLSARADEESRMESLALGADDYLLKPFNARELVVRVTTRLALARQRSEYARRERLLREAAESVQIRLEAVLSSMNDSFVMLDLDGRCTYINPSLLARTGKKREELIGTNIWKLYPEIVDTFFQTEVIAASVDRRPRCFEYFHPAWNRWFGVRVFPHDDGLSILGIDITQAKTKEATLREVQHELEQRVRERTAALADRERQLAGAQALARLGSWEWEIGTNRITWSTELYRIHGITPADLPMTFDTYLAHVHPDDRARARGEVERALRTCSAFRFEKRILRADGILRVLRAAGEVIGDDRGKPVKLIGICQDITEYRETMDALRASEERFRLLVEGVRDYAIFMLDTQGRVASWNAGAKRIKGYRADEILGRHFSIFYPPEDRVSVLPNVLLTRAAANGSAEEEGWRVRHDGSCFWASVALTALHNTAGQLQGFANIIRDASERRRGEEEMRLLHDISRAVGQSEDLRAALEAVLALVSKTAGFSFAQAWLPSDDAPSPRLSPAYHWGLEGKDCASLQRRSAAMESGLDEGWIGKACRERRLLWVEDASVDLTFHRMFEAQQCGLRAAAFVPVFVGDEVVAVTEFFAERAFVGDNRLRGLLTTVATELGLLIQRKRAEEALRISTQRLRVLSQRLLEVQECERRHIARELHDEVGQTLTALKFELQTADPRWPGCAGIVDCVDRLLEQVRGLSLDLRPSLLDDLGLVAALRWYVDRLAQKSGVPIRFQPAADHVELPGKIATSCFRIAQEALTNALRHAGASQIGILLQSDSTMVELIITDDGHGFDVDAMLQRATRGHSFGLLGMHERAMLLGGELCIESGLGNGTRVQARLPIEQKTSSEAPATARPV